MLNAESTLEKCKEGKKKVFHISHQYRAVVEQHLSVLESKKHHQSILVTVGTVKQMLHNEDGLKRCHQYKKQSQKLGSAL